jgi:hypothetical protein
MTQEARKRIPYELAPDYPTYDQALDYAKDFRLGAEGSYEHNERYARYWLASSLDILTTLLQENIYSVVAYPPAGFEVAYADDIEGYEHFRGWIIEYDPAAESWTLLVSSQEVGIDEFIRFRREYKGG